MVAVWQLSEPRFRPILAGATVLYPLRYWTDVDFCGLDFNVSADSVVAGEELSVTVIRPLAVPGCGGDGEGALTLSIGRKFFSFSVQTRLRVARRHGSTTLSLCGAS